MCLNSCWIFWCAHPFATTSHSVLKWLKSLCTCNNAYLAQHAALLLRPLRSVHTTLAAFLPCRRPACPPAQQSLPRLPWAAAPLHTAICMGNLPIAVMQECHQQTWVPPSATGTPGSPDCPMVPHLGIGQAPSIPPWVPVVNFRPVLATKQPRTLCSGPARPSVQPGPAWP